MKSNYNELFIPINFKEIARQYGVRKGSVYYSDTFKSWVIVGHPNIDMICIESPYKKGDVFKCNVLDIGRKFNGMTISNFVIKFNMWCLSFDEYWQSN